LIVRPQLKGSLVGRESEGLVIISDLLERIVLSDASGDLEALVGLLGDGTLTAGELADVLHSQRHIARADVVDAVRELDQLGLLFDADAVVSLSERQLDRYYSNLDFFAGFASLSSSAADHQRRLCDAHVVVLGAGGLGSVCLMALSGLGVGRLTVVDDDVVELRNFARQFIYRHEDIGESKAVRAAAWVHAYDPTIRIQAIDRTIAAPGDISRLLLGADLAILAANEPVESIGIWINELCVAAGVPWVAGGGGTGREVVYWSVDPGRSPCLACRLREERENPAFGPESQRVAASISTSRNRGTGPACCLMGSLVSLEAMRYLTGFAAPAAAGMYRQIDILTGAEQVHPWEQWRECPVCARAPQPAARAPTHTAARVALSG
jgi:molybdopterin/thiamine biosynthesis adenylyltransferase